MSKTIVGTCECNWCHKCSDQLFQNQDYKYNPLTDTKINMHTQLNIYIILLHAVHVWSKNLVEHTGVKWKYTSVFAPYQCVGEQTG